MKKFSILLIIIMIIGSAIAYFDMDESRHIIVYALPLTLLPFLISLKYKRFEKYMSIYIFFLFMSHFLGAILQFYDTVQHYDKFTHFASGVLISMIALDLVKSVYKDKILFTLLMVMTINLSAAVFWEFFEFFSDIILNGDAQRVKTTGVNDTMLDMLMAFSASILFCIGYWRIYGQKNISRI